MTNLSELFSEHRTLRGVIESVLEGRTGRVVHGRATPPPVARLDVGCYAIFGGDATHPEAARLVADVVAPRELLAPELQAWRDLLFETHGRRLADRPMRTFAIDRLDSGRLRKLAADRPDGFAIRPMDVPLAEKLQEPLTPHGMQVFVNARDFVAHGIGFGVVHDGRLVSAATSYTASSRHVEVAIATHPEFRGRGLAKAVAAALVGRCLELGIAPDWSAANPVSKRLALALGYRPAALCDIVYFE